MYKQSKKSNICKKSSNSAIPLLFPLNYAIIGTGKGDIIMDQTGKLAVLATILAMTALAAGCVPALDYGSVPPEPKITTKLTTTTAVSTTRKPFTTPKRRTGTVSWEELFGEEPYENKKYYNNDDDDSYSGYVPAGTGGLEIVKTGAARDNSRISTQR